MITPVYAALLALLLIALSVNVIRARRSLGVALGVGENPELQRRIRAQGNLAEYAPFFLILLGYAEHGGLTAWGLHALGGLFVTGRLLHAFSVLKAERYEGMRITANPVWRVFGMMCTFGPIVVAAAFLLTQAMR